MADNFGYGTKRYYPGYEDYSSEGRGRIRGFNKAEGGNYLSQGSNLAKYKQAMRAGEAGAAEALSNADARDLRTGGPARNADIDLQREHARQLRFYDMGK